jgi:hypothetical protein
MSGKISTTFIFAGHELSHAIHLQTEIEVTSCPSDKSDIRPSRVWYLSCRAHHISAQTIPLIPQSEWDCRKHWDVLLEIATDRL